MAYLDQLNCSGRSLLPLSAIAFGLQPQSLLEKVAFPSCPRARPSAESFDSTGFARELTVHLKDLCTSGQPICSWPDMLTIFSPTPKKVCTC